MLITAIESSVISLPFDMGGPYPLYAGQPWDHLDILVVKVETDDGLVGWGEAFGHTAIPATKAALDTIVAPLLIGRDARDINALTYAALHGTHLLGRNGPFVYAFSGVEIALWDLFGKRTGQPLWRLLGGSHAESLPAYASLLNYGDDALVAKNTAAAYAKGYRHIKLHEVTRSSVLAAHDACGADARIMLDANCAWSPLVAREMAGSLLKDGLLWLEEPVYPPEDVHGLASVRNCGIPISAGENVAGLFGFKSLIDAGAIDIAQPSITKVGGVGEMVKVIHLCQAHGVRVAPHSAYFGPGFVATIHVLAALVEKAMVEVLWLDMEANPFDPWVRAIDGRVRIPNGSGLGCDPDPAMLKRYAKGASTRTERSSK